MRPVARLEDATLEYRLPLGIEVVSLGARPRPRLRRVVFVMQEFYQRVDL